MAEKSMRMPGNAMRMHVRDVELTGVFMRLEQMCEHQEGAAVLTAQKLGQDLGFP
jgi:hypothetical protein